MIPQKWPQLQQAALSDHLEADGERAIKAFAKTDLEKAVVEPDAVVVLVDFEATVQEYEVLEGLAVNPLP
jgi:hypothetical protein